MGHSPAESSSTSTLTRQDGHVSGVDPNQVGTQGSGSKVGAIRTRRRADGPFKRSRTGCSTCKKRGKKCDEDWSPQGWCQRCIKGSWDCTGRSEGSSRPSRGGQDKRGSVSVQSQSQSSTPQPQGPPVDLGTGSELPTPLQPATASAPAPNLWSPSVPSGQSQTNQSVQTPNMSVGNDPMLAPATSQTPLSFPISDQSNNWSSYAINPFTFFGQSNGNAQSTSTNPEPTINRSSFDWSSMYVDPISHANNNINTNPFATGGRSSWMSGVETSPGWSQFDHLFAPPLQSPDGINGPSASFAFETDSVGNQTLDGSQTSRFLILNGSDRPTRRGVSLAEIYARVVESWLVGLPSTARDYARARIMALNDNNSAMRAVRYAVAIAYIILYASNPQDSKNPQPVLVEMAYRGAGLKESTPQSETIEDPGSAQSHPQSSPANNNSRMSRRESNVRGLHKEMTKGEMAKRLRLYVDHVTIPFASDEEGSRWTDAAVQELRHVMVTDKSQLSDLLWGVIDLQLVEFIRGGAAPSYNMLALGDRLVQSALGENHPPLSLTQLRSSESFSLRLFAISDLSRCIVHRGRRTLFEWNDDMGTTSAMGSAGDEEPWGAYLGLPDSIVLILAKVVNLCADMSSTSKATIQTRAETLEARIRDWQPTQVNQGGGTDATAIVSRTIAGQLWRLCALVLLYQSVYQVGTLHPVLRHARSEMLSLLESIVRLPNGDLWGFVGLPSFLAATLSISESDRQKSMGHMMRPGPEKMWLDNIALVEKIWEEVDETGKSVDWYDKLQREGMSVAFF